MTKGVLYVGTADRFIDEAIESAKSIKGQCDLPIAIAAHRDIDSPYVDKVIELADPDYGFADKVTAIPQSPWERTLYLDTDTYIDGDILPIFDLLDRVDVAVAHAPNRDEPQRIQDEIPETFPEFNLGVIAYKDSQNTRELLNLWEKKYRKYENNATDQPAFREAAWKFENIDIGTLPPEYNMFFNPVGFAAGRVKIFHGRVHDIESEGGRQRFQLEHIVSKINQTTRPRVFFHSYTGGMRLVTNKTKLLRNIPIRLRQQGIAATLLKVRNKIFS